MSKKDQQHNLQKNEIITLQINDINHEGQGVGKHEGFTVFVKGALPGETVEAKIILLKKSFAVGRLMQVIQASTERVEPPCPIYKQCGGCQLQHLDYAAQLKYKREQVINQLQRIGKLDLEQVVVHPTLGMENPWQYRNKAQLPIGEEEGGLIGGFYRQGTHEIVEMEACLIQHEENDLTIAKVKEIASELGIRAYREDEHRGLLRHVVVKYGFATNEVMVVLIINGDKLPKEQALIERLIKALPNVKSIYINRNTKKTNVIFGDDSRLLWGEAYIYDTIGSIRFAISPRSFYQVNPVQTKVLYDKALEYAALEGQETVIDAYCGIGTISLFLAQKAKRVLGVEIVPEAIADAKRNARMNSMENVEFAVGEAEKVIPWWKAQGIEADVIVVDPPRKGCDEALLETMIQMQPKRIVYVSCNPSTLARDLRILEDGGYRTVEVQPVDMFPHTSHVECCSLLIYEGK